MAKTCNSYMWNRSRHPLQWMYIFPTTLKQLKGCESVLVMIKCVFVIWITSFNTEPTTNKSFGLLFFSVSMECLNNVSLQASSISISHVYNGIIIFFLTAVTFFKSGTKSFRVGQKVSETFYTRDKKSLKLFVLG